MIMEKDFVQYEKWVGKCQTLAMHWCLEQFDDISIFQKFPSQRLFLFMFFEPVRRIFLWPYLYSGHSYLFRASVLCTTMSRA
jgi:hypothetical protein